MSILQTILTEEYMEQPPQNRLTLTKVKEKIKQFKLPKINMNGKSGALIGAGAGLLVGHPIIGAAIGGYAGHKYHKSKMQPQNLNNQPQSNQPSQQ